MIIYTSGVGHMAKVVAMTIYCKNFESFETKFHVKTSGSCGTKLYKRSGSNDKDGRHVHIW